MIGWSGGVRVLWNGGTQVYVRVQPGWSGKLEGLCGNYNQNKKDDFVRQDGILADTAYPFANSWKLKEACPDVEKNPETPCDIHPVRQSFAEAMCSWVNKYHNFFLPSDSRSRSA